LTPCTYFFFYNIGSFGLIFTGPALHHWYTLLEKLANGNIVAKVALDQLIFRPFFLVAIYFYLSLFSGGTTEFIRNVRRDLFRVTLNAWKYWTPMQIINFYWVPLHLRVLFSNLAALLWNIYFSLRTSKPLPRPPSPSTSSLSSSSGSSSP